MRIHVDDGYPLTLTSIRHFYDHIVQTRNKSQKKHFLPQEKIDETEAYFKEKR